MTTMDIQTLVDLTRTLGEPQRELVVVGEGNTSFRSSEESFWIKASGQGMNNIGPNGFVEVYFEPILDLIANSPSERAESQRLMEAAKVDASVTLKPSVEVTFHAMLLKECDVRYIGHTHPVAVNGILCSTRAEQFAFNRMFPDEAVLCGPQSVLVPYLDPGLPLANGIGDGTRRYMDKYGEAPKVILLANHGLIALGQTPNEVLNITAMCVKAAQIFTGAYVVGEPVFLSEAEIMHIYKRPDEQYRRVRFVTGS